MQYNNGLRFGKMAKKRSGAIMCAQKQPTVLCFRKANATAIHELFLLQSIQKPTIQENANAVNAIIGKTVRQYLKSKE